jgi:subtilisin family serine protease
MRRTSFRPSPCNRLTLEVLEHRNLLSVAAVPTDMAAPADGRIAMLWQGAMVTARADHWIVGVDGLNGSRSERIDALDQFLRGRNSGLEVQVRRHLGGNAFLVETTGSPQFDTVRASLAGIPGFQYVEPDLICAATAIPNDTYFNLLDGMNNTGQDGGTFDADIDAPEAWSLTTGSKSVIVGVIDSGVDYNHPDIAPNIWTNPYEVASNGVDDDGNGYIDDVHGYDFLNDDGDPWDDNGHGTHVAGTIGAAGNNTLGVVGVSWNVSIMALKFLGPGGSGTISAGVEAIYYANMMRQWGQNVRVTNNSWGSGGYSQALKDAIVASANADILFAAAAGNESENSDASPHYPSGYDVANIVAVAAVNN